MAILDGGFRYFCDSACKNAYVDALSKRPLLDSMMTADPPPVASAARSAQPPVVASGVREAPKTAEPSFPPVGPLVPEDMTSDDEDEASAAPSVRVVPPVSPTHAHAGPHDGNVRAEPSTGGRANDRDESADLDGSPSTLRSPSVRELEPAPPSSERVPPSRIRPDRSLGLPCLARPERSRRADQRAHASG
ncbi:MAG TPA: hypothetical protein VM925_36865 [Labilithrix sp.]|nr:hypothetical protein [Labilithrix sp.]